MGLISHIENLRGKPEHVRKRVAFWYSFGITAIIFTFWVSSFNIVGQKAQGTLAKNTTENVTPGQSMVAAVGTLFDDVRDMFFGAKKIEYSSVEVVSGKR